MNPQQPDTDATPEVDSDEIRKAVKLLRLGEVVGLPTETVYGLAARIDLPRAIEKIFTIKERPFFDPLIVHIASIEQAMKLTSRWGEVAQALAESFWPGPLTLVLPKAPSVNSMITSGLDTVGLRMPRHEAALEIILEVGVPLAAPSANKFGRTSPTKAEHVRSEFMGEKIFVVDGGDCEVGIESTVLLVKETSDYDSDNSDLATAAQAVAELAILRKGQFSMDELSEVLSNRNLKFKFIEAVSKKESPGHMKHHYMPAIPLIIAKSRTRSPDELLVAINDNLKSLPDIIEGVRIHKPVEGIQSYKILDLPDDSVLAARELYAELRRMGESEGEAIVFYVESYHGSVSWEGLFDRLNKAASLILD